MNSSISQYLYKLYSKGRLSHANLIETDNIQQCRKDVENFIKNISCNETYQEKCDKCNICHLIELHNLPSYVLLEPENGTIKKEAIEQVKERFSSVPIYTPYNIYVILEPELMNSTAYNKLLKFIEEPENNIIGILITKDKDNVAPTIKSRCEHVKNYYKEDNNEINEHDDINEAVNNYLESIKSRSNSLYLFKKDIVSTINSRENFIVFLKKIYSILSCDMYTNLSKLTVIKKYMELITYNVNLNLAINSFNIEMREADNESSI